jgi:hypothetical protein
MAGLHITLPFHRLTFCLVRRQATDFEVSGAPRPSIETTIEATEGRQPAVQVDNELGEGPPSPRGRTRGTRRPRERMLFTQTRFASPDARFDCDGWCKHSDVPHANVVSIRRLLLWDSGSHTRRQLSLSACSDLQRAWEGPKGSLTTVLCNYLSQCILCNATERRSDTPIREAQ